MPTDDDSSCSMTPVTAFMRSEHASWRRRQDFHWRDGLTCYIWPDGPAASAPDSQIQVIVALMAPALVEYARVTWYSLRQTARE